MAQVILLYILVAAFCIYGADVYFQIAALAHNYWGWASSFSMTPFPNLNASIMSLGIVLSPFVIFLIPGLAISLSGIRSDKKDDFVFSNALYFWYYLIAVAYAVCVGASAVGLLFHFVGWIFKT